MFSARLSFFPAAVAAPSGYSGDVAISNGTAPRIHAYKFSTSTGFGTKYANPTTGMNGLSRTSRFNPAKTAVAASNDSGPTVNAWRWTLGSGFGTKYSNPASGAALLVGVAYNNAGNYVSAAGDGATLTAWAWDDTNGFGTRYSPSSAPNGTSWACWFNPTDTAILSSWTTGSTSTPNFAVWAWSNSTRFGTRYANPSGPINGPTFNAQWHPSGNAIAIAMISASPFIQAFPWDNSTGWGTRYSNPGTLPTAGLWYAEWNPSGNVIGSSQHASNKLNFYTWNNSTGFGTRYAEPSTLPGGNGRNLHWTPDGSVVMVTSSGSPYVQAYAWNDATGFGTKFANPSSMLTSESLDFDFTKP